MLVEIGEALGELVGHMESGYLVGRTRRTFHDLVPKVTVRSPLQAQRSRFRLRTVAVENANLDAMIPQNVVMVPNDLVDACFFPGCFVGHCYFLVGPQGLPSLVPHRSAFENRGAVLGQPGAAVVSDCIDNVIQGLSKDLDFADFDQSWRHVSLWGSRPLRIGFLG